MLDDLEQERRDLDRRLFLFGYEIIAAQDTGDFFKFTVRKRKV